MSNNVEVYPLLRDDHKYCDIGEVRGMIRSKQKIALIKEYRAISGLGLKQSKDAVESHQITKASRQGNGSYALAEYKEEELVEDFMQYLVSNPDPYTKEEFLNNIEQAIDGMGVYQCTDMLEAVEYLLDNIKKRGGLEVLAKERDEFLRKI
jgi:hypothetical protein